MEENSRPVAKLLGLLGMARKAGKLLIGADLAMTGIRSGSVRIALLTADASGNTGKRIRNCCVYYQTEGFDVPFTADQLSHAIGKSGPVAVVGVTDDHFAAGIRAILNEASMMPFTSDKAQQKQREEER